MVTAPPHLIDRAVEILGGGASSEAMEADISALTPDRMLARRLIDWPPEAFGIVLVLHLGNVVLPTTFTARSKIGQWVEFSFDAEPIFQEALRLAAAMYHSGQRDTFSNIALRSSIVAAVNRALNAGSSLDGAELSGPALIGIPAEAYGHKAPPIWRRIFQ